MRLAILLSVGIWAVLLMSISGCGAIGVSKVDFWGAKMEFSEGIDYRVGFNAIDSVNDNRGLKGSEFKAINEGRKF